VEEEQRQNAESLRKAEIGLATKLREKDQAESRLTSALDVESKIAMIDKLQPALTAYMDRLTTAKIAALQSEVTHCYNRLARKTDYIRRVEIDPRSFEVSVIDKYEHILPKADLSSGENQLFAISMLWGLARTSGRALPVVIDTPLGRLDSDHRCNLVANYFPHAGHQVILLSTDTEVDLPLFKEMSSSISHCYHLKYNEKENRTEVEEGYFW
jgi:DNA sulfur modification protein DndD